MKTLSLLQSWYSEQCNGVWEHAFGIKIETIDNPGWSVEIDLGETSLSNKHVPEFIIEHSADDWIRCFVKEAKFYGYGDPSKLESILSFFLKEITDCFERVPDSKH